MNKDIKEILDYLSDDSKSFIICGVSYYKISDYKAKVLLDYITNLQNKIKDLEDTIIDKHDCIEAQNDTITNLQEDNKAELLKILKGDY